MSPLRSLGMCVCVCVCVCVCASVRACVCVCAYVFNVVQFDKLRLILYIPVNNFFSHVRTGLPGLNQYKAVDKRLAQGHNTVTTAAVRLEPATL